MLRPILTIATTLLVCFGSSADGRTAASARTPLRPSTATLAEYPVPLKGNNWGEGGIVAGPDGAMWFTAISGDGKGQIYGSAIVRVTNDRKFKIYLLPRTTIPGEIARGSDGALWFTETGRIGRITTDGKVSSFNLPPGFGSPGSITLGPDGAIWFTAAFHGIARITVRGVVSRILCTTLCSPREITTGPDGALWTTDWSLHGLDRFSPTALPTFVNVEGAGGGLTKGPDGSLWICGSRAIDRYDVASGKLTNFQTPNGNDAPNEIAAGGDGALWFTNPERNEVDRLDTSGHFQQYQAPQQYIFPNYIAPSPDGSLWFTNTDSKAIGHIVFQ